MLGVSLVDKDRNEVIRQKTQVTDRRIPTHDEVEVAGHVCKRAKEANMRPPMGKRSVLMDR